METSTLQLINKLEQNIDLLTGNKNNITELIKQIKYRLDNDPKKSIIKKQNTHNNKKKFPINEYKKKEKFINNIKNMGYNFSIKLLLGCSLMNSIQQFKEKEIVFAGSQFEMVDYKNFLCSNDMIISGGICGSLTRQLFELPFFLADMRSCTDPQGHDLDILIFDIRFINDISKFIYYANEFIKKYMNLLYSSIKKDTVKIGSYEIIDIINITLFEVAENSSLGKKNLLNIPHYLIKFQYKNDIIDVDIIGWKPIVNTDYFPIGDFDVNNLLLSNNGLLVCNTYNSRNPYSSTFFNIIQNISNSTASCLIDFELLNKYLNTNNKIHKISTLRQIQFFISERWLKLLSNGYNEIVQKRIIEVSTELVEECCITCETPPYTVIVLSCGHKISLLALKYMTEEKNLKYLKFKCHLCRKALEFKIITKDSINELFPFINNAIDSTVPVKFYNNNNFEGSY